VGGVNGGDDMWRGRGGGQGKRAVEEMMEEEGGIGWVGDQRRGGRREGGRRCERETEGGR